MTYAGAIRFLYDLQFFGMKLGLENAFRLAALAGNPQNGLRFIHVAGTNGKGSTCAMLEAIYRAAGLRVGLFTSPHLVSFAERIQVNRHLIGKADVAQLTEEMRTIIDSGAFPEAPPTFFEVVTVMALRHFAAQKCDLVIWETGMGGRLDATNIVTPLASVITNVQLDHQKWLGESIPQIAREKAGIIKPGIPVITAAEAPAALEVIAESARSSRSPLTRVSAAYPFETALSGEHQKINAALAVATVGVLRPQIPVPEDAVRSGLRDVQWAGRLQTVHRPGGQTILLDGAHNPAGAETLAAALRSSFPGRRPALILGTLADKDYAAMCRILAPLASKILLSPVASGRTADPALLAGHCRQANPAAEITACKHLAEALEKTNAEQFIVVAGSLHFLGEAMELLSLAASSDERALNDYSAPSILHPPSSILAVSFDIGGTLIEAHPSVGHVYAEVAARHGIHVSPDELNRRFAAAWKTKSKFNHLKADWADLVDRTFDGLAKPPPSKSFFPELFDAFASPATWRIYDDVLPCLDGLRRRGIKLAAISNWDERLRPLLKALNLDVWFDSIVISAEVGHPKPNPAMFNLAANQLGLPPASILHIGDSRVEDFEGARAAGFQSLLIRRGEPARAGEQLASLSSLPFP